MLRSFCLFVFLFFNVHSALATEYNQNDLALTLNGKVYVFATKDGQLISGVVNEYNADGVLKSKGEVRNGLRNDVKLEYDAKGNLMSETSFSDGLRSGKRVEYYPGGGKKAEMEYYRHKLHGLKVQYEVDGQIISQTNYNNGAEVQSSHGEAEYNLKDLTVSLSGNKVNVYKTKDGKLVNGIVNEYYSGGTLKSKGGVKNGLRSGLKREYDAKGRLESETTFTEGLRTGRRVEYYPGGGIKAEMEYHNHKLHGSEFQYDQTGILVAEIHYDNGRQTQFYDGDGWDEDQPSSQTYSSSSKVAPGTYDPNKSLAEQSLVFGLLQIGGKWLGSAIQESASSGYSHSDSASSTSSSNSSGSSSNKKVAKQTGVAAIYRDGPYTHITCKNGEKTKVHHSSSKPG